MHSDKGFERFCKLLSSLFTLVVGEKRHLETVTALLQRLVFEKTAWPKYKNWPEISKLGRTMVMATIATLDLEKDAHAQSVIAAFPQCFSDTEVMKSVPKSEIIRVARENAARSANSLSVGEEKPVSVDALFALGIPYLTFNSGPAEKFDPAYPILPNEVLWGAGLDAQWNTLSFNGKSFIVAEDNSDDGLIHLVPAECIDVTC